MGGLCPAGWCVLEGVLGVAHFSQRGATIFQIMEEPPPLTNTGIPSMRGQYASSGMHSYSSYMCIRCKHSFFCFQESFKCVIAMYNQTHWQKMSRSSSNLTVLSTILDLGIQKCMMKYLENALL